MLLSVLVTLPVVAATWYQPADSPVYELFKRQNNGTAGAAPDWRTNADGEWHP